MKYGHRSRLISSSLRATRLDLDTNFHNRLGRRGSSSTAKRCQTEARSHATGGEGRGMVGRGQKFAWPTASTSKPITAATLALAKQLRPAFEGIERPVVEPVEQQAEVPSRSIPAARPSRDEHRQLLLHPNAALRGAMTRLKPKEDVVELQRLPSTVVLWDSEVRLTS